MLDAAARRLIDPPLNRLGRVIAGYGIAANTVTMVGLGLGIVAAGLIGFGYPALALIPLLASRLADGLDGAVRGRRSARILAGTSILQRISCFTG